MEAINLFQHALILIILLSAPPLVVATVVGVGISLVQTLFQIQDQTVPFFIKLVAVSVTLLLTARWMQAELVTLTNQAFLAIGNVGR
ncbi:type III secretion system export apparatus subunit SctS [Noviherbaspirillum saxi]|uniref:EscS/YscS/HrcS family type III secretion system export apparatus protein n=1 Tax=Noviherbaspirillum saxi TaxID=2320863 RepID=A0A3A3FKW4_9BURK|nr:type III secretion system export apparatus subunit SctS [Noviherbaspirillum saxi]RJF92152.1 EscS/YscS/HrcS family type III secretion system export apparatus protein [Noviherbaspirillum saxi]